MSETERIVAEFVRRQLQDRQTIGSFTPQIVCECVESTHRFLSQIGSSVEIDVAAIVDVVLQNLADSECNVVAKDETGTQIVLDGLASSNKLSEVLQNQTLFRSMFQLVPVGIAQCDPDGILELVNPALCAMLGCSPEHLIGISFMQFVHPVDRKAGWQEFIAARDQRQILISEKRFLRGDDSVGWAQISLNFEKLRNVVHLKVIAVVEDITERRGRDAALRISEQRLAKALELARLGNWYWDVANDLSSWSESACRIFGVDPDRFNPNFENFLALVHPDDREIIHRQLDLVAAGKDKFEYDIRIITPTGETRWVHTIADVLRDESGRLTMLRGTDQDVTEQVVAERQLRESERRLQRLADAMPQIVWIANPDGSLQFRNPRGNEILGSDSFENPASAFHPEEEASTLETWRRCLHEGTPYQVEHRLRTTDGSFRWYLTRGLPIYADDGSLECWYGTTTDVQDLKESEAALRDERERLLAISRSSPGVIHSLVIRPDGSSRFQYVASSVCTLCGIDAESLELDASPFFDRIHADDVQHVTSKLWEPQPTRQQYVFEFRLLHPTRGEIWVESRQAPSTDADGATVWHGTFTDVTTTRSMRERLIRSNKMEAIGRLAGGVAHDFNNLLTIILVECEILLASPTGDPSRDNPLGAIRDAGKRASALTKQLLTFGRRDLTQPEIVNLNHQIEMAAHLLQRMAGDSITCEFNLSAVTPWVRIDRVHVEQIVFNLVSNAIDAMPGGGTLRVNTRVLPAHEPSSNRGNVEIAISDSGSGFDPEHGEKLFDPFFTTKAVGRGTGLGLAVVHGIAQQLGGSVDATSSPNGATFTVTLPLSTLP